MLGLRIPEPLEMTHSGATREEPNASLIGLSEIN